MGVVGAVDKNEPIAFIQEIHRVYNLIYTEVVDSCEIREIHSSDGIEIIRFYFIRELSWLNFMSFVALTAELVMLAPKIKRLAKLFVRL